MEKTRKRKPIPIIDNSIVTTHFSEQVCEKGAEPKTIVSVDHLSVQNNPLFALEIISELFKLQQDFVYAWIGDGELRGQVEKAIREKGL